MSSSKQDGAIVSCSKGYSSPRNLERGLQMLPLAAAAAEAQVSRINSTGASAKQLAVLSSAHDGFYSPMISPRSSAPNALSSKPQVPMLALAQLPAPKPASKPAQPLPVVAYKPKPKPVSTAFGYRVSPAASPRNNNSSSSADKGSSNASVVKVSGSSKPSSRPGSSNGKSTGSGNTSSGSFDSRKAWGSKTPRSCQADAAAAPQPAGNSKSSSSSNSSRRAPGHSSTTSNSSSRRTAPQPCEDDRDGETIFLDCAADEGRAEAGSGRSGGKQGASFTLSCAISAVFNHSSNGAEGGADGLTPRRLLQSAAAAFLSSVQQGAANMGYAQRQKQRAAASNTSSSCNGNSTRSSNSSKIPKPSTAAAAAPTGGAAAPRRAAPASSTTSQALVVSQPSHRAAAATDAAKPGASKAATRAPSPAAAPATSSMQMVQVSGACNITPARPSPAKGPSSCSSTALAVRDSGADVAAAATAKPAGATIFMQLQGSFPAAEATGSPKARGSSSRPGKSAISIEDLFASLDSSGLDSSEAGSSDEGYRSASEGQSSIGLPEGDNSQSESQSLALQTAPGGSWGTAALQAASAGLPFGVVTSPGAGMDTTTTTTTTITTESEAEGVRFHSAGTAASWAAGSSASEGDSSSEAMLEWAVKQQRVAFRPYVEEILGPQATGPATATGPAAAAAVTEISTLSAAAAAAAPAAAAVGATAATAAAAAAAAVKGTSAATADAREVLLTISPTALPFLAARSLSQTPVRLYITPDAVWGDTAAFSAAPSPRTPRGGSKSPRLTNPLKAVRGVISRGQQQRGGEAGEGEMPGCAGGLFRSISGRASRCE